MFPLLITALCSSLMIVDAHSLKGGGVLSSRSDSQNTKTLTIDRSDVTVFASSVVRFYHAQTNKYETFTFF